MMDPNRRSLPADFSGRVRLFPLPDLVVFPGNLQPLHVFEPRYCEMLEEALETDQLVTMATLLSATDTGDPGQPPIAPVVCIGQVIAHQQNGNGTHDILLAGIQRACIEEEAPLIRSFREADVLVLSDTPETDPDLPAESIFRELQAQFLSLVAAQHLQGKSLLEELPLGLMADVLAFHLPLRTSLKLQLLAEPNVVRRARSISAALNGEDSRGFGRGTIPFSVN